MAKNGLNKEQTKEKAALVEALGSLGEELRGAVVDFNAEMATAWEPVQKALDAYNAKIVEANEWQGTVAEAARAAFDEKSEKWQEGEKGQALTAFAEVYEEELEEVELEAPAEVEEPELPAGEALDEKINEPE